MGGHKNWQVEKAIENHRKGLTVGIAINEPCMWTKAEGELMTTEAEYTIYERIIGTEANPPTKWRSTRTPEGQRLFYTGRTIHVIENESGTWIGLTMCNPIDTFDKRMGRRLARARAFGAFQRYEFNMQHNRPLERGLFTASWKTYKGRVFNGAALSDKTGYMRIT